MYTIKLVPDIIRRKRLRWQYLGVAALVGLGLGIGQGVAAPGGVPGKPIKTKSATLQALTEATIALQGFPANETDFSAVPHYFGPWPNWANSPFTLADVAVEITGDGNGATATATVGANGAVTGITITNPGSGYTSATVNFTGAGTGAAADATVTTSGAVTSVTVTNGGAGFTAPQVAIDPPTGGGTTATATAFGGVDAVTLIDAGTGYRNPTVDFDMPDGADGMKAVGHAVTIDNGDGTVTITAIVVDQPGSGYSFKPNVVIRDGTLFDPTPGGGTGATASATLAVQTVVLDTFGSGYTSDPTVSILEEGVTDLGATATAATDFGAVTAIKLTAGGSGYITAGGIKKFVDTLPGLCNPSLAGSCDQAANNLGQYVPLAVADTTTFTKTNGFADDADYYEIGLVQYRKRMSSSLPAKGTLLRGYVQLETPANAPWSKHVPLCNERLDGTGCDAVTYPGTDTQVYGVDEPQFLGPVIAATKDRPVRITFYNLLPAGQGGDLYIPTDSTLMGSGFLPDAWRHLTDAGSVLDEVRNPPCTTPVDANDNPISKSDAGCFKDSRATLHLHGGLSPWISDGTPHQWITPFEDVNPYPEGASVGQVPDMTGAAVQALGVPDCSGENDGCQTFYYTNQQSARLMFYHDHAFGTTRLNVYLGEAAGYLIGDKTEQKLVDSGTIPGPADTIPLIIQDRTFVPDVDQLGEQDPTWDYNRWGGYGDFWYHHVYMPAQNPGDPSGMSAYGRWMYGPWFWPPATPPYGPIDNPYYDANCSLDDPATWTYQTDPFCEPKLIPGTPNVSAGMEQFNDTPLVNGTAYPTVTLAPKTYRLRVLNAANDRFFNLQLYVGDPTSAVDPAIGPTEVALNPAELAAAQLDPVVFPTPVDANNNAAGPDWIVIGSEGGFLPAPAVVDGQQPTTWITDPTRFDVGNVDKHSLLLAPAERADVILDLSQFAGKTLILYNDAPAAFPARVPSYDYYTGAPDQYPVGAPTILPGYGPNTRTVMQIKVEGTPAAPFNLTRLRNAFSHKADGSGVFEEGQHPIIVGQAAYNSAYGTQFYASGDCNFPGSTSIRCDGMLRIDEQGGTKFGFNTLKLTDKFGVPTGKLEVMIEPKGIHDEMNSAAFDEFGRMSANMGLEVAPATPNGQNIVLYPYINPPTELLDGTKLPRSMSMTPIASAEDGTQIWKITHNGVDTHPLHFHLYDVQVLNRVAWDNIITPNHPTEFGWKDTVRVSPLQDTIVALRPVVPELPFDLPNSIRLLNPAMPAGSQLGFANIDALGNPTPPITNQLVNFGWEYVWHCHILSHEEMDMMRPQSLALPPYIPSGLAWTISGTGNNTVLNLTWTDNSIDETEFVVQKTTDGVTWANLATLVSPLNQANTSGTTRTYTDTAFNRNAATAYRVVAQNTVGYGGAFMSLSAKSEPSTPVAVILAPTNLTAALQAGPQVSLTWTDNATNETGFVIQRSTNGGAFTQIGTAPARNNTGSVTFADATVVAGTTYAYRVAAVNAAGTSAFSNTASVSVAVPSAPSNVNATAVRQGNNERVTLTWTDNATNESGFEIQRATNATFTAGLATNTVGANVTSFTTGNIPKLNYYFRIRAVNLVGPSDYVNATPFPVPPSN